MIAGSLLPSGSAPLELALDAAIGARFPLRTDLVRAMWSPDHCPAELLGFLAYQLSVDLWDEAWPETQKRQLCRDALRLHRLKTTVAGIRAYVGLTGAQLVKVVRPPARIYATSGMTPAEREAWLQTLPQIRLYPFDRRPLGSRQAFLSGPAGRFFFAGCYPRVSRGPQLTGTRATRWDRGVETPIAYEQLDAGALRMLIPSTGRRAFLGYAFLGRAFAQTSAATGNVVTLRLSGDVAGFAAAAGLDPVDIEPTRIFQPRTAPRARAFLGNATGRRWLLASWGPRLVYDRVSLNDPTRIAARRVGRVFLGHARLGSLPFQAELRISVPLTRSRLRAARFAGHGFLGRADLSGVTRAVKAVTAAKAARDTILITTTTHRPVSFNDGLRFGQFRFGDIRKVA